MLPMAFDVAPLLSGLGHNKKPVFFRKKQIVFSSGDRSDAMFYVQKGAVKLTVVSATGREALIALVGGGNFFGESCLFSGSPVRLHTAIAVSDIQVLKLDCEPMIRILRTNAPFAYDFITYLLRRNQEIQQDLADNLMSFSERRLSRVLSSLKRLRQGDEGDPLLRLSQQDLANIVGITRQRVNVLLKRRAEVR